MSVTTQALPGVLNNLPATLRTRSKAKDLLIAALTNTQLCALHLDPGLLDGGLQAQ